MFSVSPTTRSKSRDESGYRPREGHRGCRRRKCPTCWYSWLDKYNKAECPKCLSPMPSGESCGRRVIHTDRVTSNRCGDIKKERHVIERYRQMRTPRKYAHRYATGTRSMSPSRTRRTTSSTSSSFARQRNPRDGGGVCPITGGSHEWRFGKCRHCGVGEGYVRFGTPTRPSSAVRNSSGNKGRYQQGRIADEWATEDVRYEEEEERERRRRRTRSGGRGGGAGSGLKRRTCPICGFRWLDKYRKMECPKCLMPLDDGVAST